MRLIENAFNINKSNLKLDWNEVYGEESNHLISKCFKSVDGLGNDEMLDDSKISWCSCYMNFVVQEAGGKGTRSPAARSWLRWGRKSTGVPGDIVILKRGKESWMGHVGQLYKKGIIFVYVIGGNQAGTLNISKFLRKDVLDYRTSND